MHAPVTSAAWPRRRFLAGLGCLLAAGCAPRAGQGPGAARPTLSRVAEGILPHRVVFEGTTVGGLSAIDHDPASGLYDLLSDDRSELGPARLYRARLQIDTARGTITPTLEQTVMLRQADGRTWPPRSATPHGQAVPDPESMRRLPGGNFLWGSDGDERRGFGPTLMECAPDGRALRSFAVPDHFTPAGRTRGARDNLGFEGLALTPDARGVWAAMEAALWQDGPEPTVQAPGGPCRFTLFDMASGRAVRQIAYVPDAIPEAPLLPHLYAGNGVSEVLMLDAHQLLVLERAYAVGRGNSLRLYRIDTRAASDTLAQEALVAGRHRPAAKTLVADFSGLGLAQLDNTEGMAWGPALPDGRRLLVVVSDDNFNATQVTQFAAFAFG